MGEKAEWSNLPTELWLMIAKFLENRIDVLRFRSVCESCQSPIPPPHPISPSFPLKIPHPKKSFKRAFLHQANFYLVEPPDEESFCLEPSPSSSSSSRGWLIKVEKLNLSHLQSYPFLLCRLLNPLSDRKILFPSCRIMSWNLLDRRGLELCQSCTVESSRHGDAAAVTKVVFFPCSSWTNVEDSVACCIYSKGKLGFMKYGDKKWTLVDDKNFFYDDVIVYKGQFYVTDRWGTVSWVDISSLKLMQHSPLSHAFGKKKHMVESSGSLHVVNRYYDSYAVDVVVDFKVYRLDEEWGRWVDVKNLEDKVFILGRSCSLSVSAKEISGFQGNCIYFTCKYPDVRVYNLDDRSIHTIDLDPFRSKLFCPLHLGNSFDLSMLAEIQRT